MKILTSLATGEPREFVHLRRVTGLTDRNLCSHTRRLECAGLVVVEKRFRDRKPVTQVSLTSHGRDALERHARELLAALGLDGLRSPVDLPVPPRAQTAMAEFPQPVEADDWVD